MDLKATAGITFFCDDALETAAGACADRVAHAGARVGGDALVPDHRRAGWQELEVMVDEGCATQLLIDGKVRCNQIPQPRLSLQQLLNATQVALPAVLPSKGVSVATKKKLAPRRKKR